MKNTSKQLLIRFMQMSEKYGGTKMSVNFKSPQIAMELYETDICELQKFIENKEKQRGFTEEYLILYDFAIDCKYSTYIQPELIRYLLPFYIKVVEQAVLYKNQIAIDIFLNLI